MACDCEVVVRIASAQGNGQDRALYVRVPGGIAIVVADGAGGIGDGATAAERVITCVADEFRSGTFEHDSLWWCDQLKELDLQLCNEGIGEATAVVLLCTGENVFGGSVGDSCAWVLNENGIIDLTSLQKRKPLLGTGCAMVYPLSSNLLKGTLLVATDGLFKYAPRQSIQETVLKSPLEQAAADLIDLARLPSGGLQDDVAVVLCR